MVSSLGLNWKMHQNQKEDRVRKDNSWFGSLCLDVRIMSICQNLKSLPFTNNGSDFVFIFTP